MKLTNSILASVLFILLLFLTYYIHIAFFNVNVVFYAAIADGIISAVLTGALVFLIPYFRSLSGFEKLLLLIIWLLGGYAFSISVPTVIDRSLSFYILEKIQQRGGGIKEDRIEDVFTKEYVKEHRLMDVRLTEQLESGTIIIDNGCVKLTKKGDEIASFGRFFRKNFLPRKRLLMGEYTDDLTDPFRDDQYSGDYRCK
jgi:hypothetical protein